MLKKYQAKVIYEDFAEKISIQLEIDKNTADKFIDITKELSSGNIQISIIK